MKNFVCAAAFIAAIALQACQTESHRSVVTFEREEIEIETGSEGMVYLLDGNGGYTWSFSVRDVADVLSVEYGTVRIKALMPGETVLTITDRLETSDSLKVIIK